MRPRRIRRRLMKSSQEADLREVLRTISEAGRVMETALRVVILLLPFLDLLHHSTW